MAQPPIGHGQENDFTYEIDNPAPEIMKNMIADFEIETNLPYRPSFETHNYLIDQKVNKEVSEILTAALTEYIDKAIPLVEKNMQLCSIEVLSVDYFQPVRNVDRDGDGRCDLSVAENVTYWD